MGNWSVDEGIYSCWGGESERKLYATPQESKNDPNAGLELKHVFYGGKYGQEKEEFPFWLWGRDLAAFCNFIVSFARKNKIELDNVQFVDDPPYRFIVGVDGARPSSANRYSRDFTVDMTKEYNGIGDIAIKERLREMQREHEADAVCCILDGPQLRRVVAIVTKFDEVANAKKD